MATLYKCKGCGQEMVYDPYATHETHPETSCLENQLESMKERAEVAERNAKSFEDDYALTINTLTKTLSESGVNIVGPQDAYSLSDHIRKIISGRDLAKIMQMSKIKPAYAISGYSNESDRECFTYSYWFDSLEELKTYVENMGRLETGYEVSDINYIAISYGGDYIGRYVYNRSVKDKSGIWHFIKERK